MVVGRCSRAPETGLTTSVVRGTSTWRPSMVTFTGGSLSSSATDFSTSTTQSSITRRTRLSLMAEYPCSWGDVFCQLAREELDHRGDRVGGDLAQAADRRDAHGHGQLVDQRQARLREALAEDLADQVRQL